jgi:hypothetical protein
MSFFNRMWDKFHNEIDEANADALKGDYDTGPGPFMAVHYRNGEASAWDCTAGFRQMVQSGRKFKWTLNLRGDLGVIAPTLKHSVAAGGGDVHTAGHGVYQAGGNQLVLDNDTGHYHTSVESLGLARRAWEHLGYNVQFKARVDYSKLF